MEIKKIVAFAIFGVFLSTSMGSTEEKSNNWSSLGVNIENISSEDLIHTISANSLWAAAVGRQMMEFNDGVGDIGWIVVDNKDTVVFKICGQDETITVKRTSLKKTDKSCEAGIPTVVDWGIIAKYSKDDKELQFFKSDPFVRKILDISPPSFPSVDFLGDFKLGSLACNQIPVAMMAALDTDFGVYSDTAMAVSQTIDNEPFISTVPAVKRDGCIYFGENQDAAIFTILPSAQKQALDGVPKNQNSLMWQVMKNGTLLE